MRKILTISTKLLLSFITLYVTSSLSFAQEIDTTPDISGYWMIEFGAIPPQRPATEFEQLLIDDLKPESILLADSGLREFPPGDFGGMVVTPAAKAFADEYDVEVQRSVSKTCASPSIIYSMQGPFPIEIFQGTELIVIKMEYFDVVRIIFMNEDEHPNNWPHSLTGHSIGRWENDSTGSKTLVVDTAYIQASTLLNNGLEHSENLSLQERFRVSPDGKTLLVTQEFEDPEVFAGSAARIMPMTSNDEHVYPYDCDPGYGAAIQAREL